MSKYRVPEEGLKAAVAAAWSHVGFSSPQASPAVRKEIEESFRSALEAFIAWQTENPIVPTEEQDEDLCEWCEMNPDGSPFAEWQRRMYLAPEPEVQEEIRDLLLVNITEGFFKPEVLNERLAEAYRRGQKSVHA